MLLKCLLKRATMQPDISLLRLYTLRAFYAFVLTGLAIVVWPSIVAPPSDLSMSGSVVDAFLGGVGLLALLGIRYPVKMLPLLFFEFVWKLIWLVAHALPLLLGDALTAGAVENAFACLLGVVLIPLVLPWSYVRRQYWRAASDPWRKSHEAAFPDTPPTNSFKPKPLCGSA